MPLAAAGRPLDRSPNVADLLSSPHPPARQDLDHIQRNPEQRRVSGAARTSAISPSKQRHAAFTRQSDLRSHAAAAVLKNKTRPASAEPVVNHTHNAQLLSSVRHQQQRVHGKQSFFETEHTFLGEVMTHPISFRFTGNCNKNKAAVLPWPE